MGSVRVMSDVETSEAQASDLPLEVIAEATTEAGPGLVELVLEETPSMTPDQLTRQAQEACDRVLDASKRLGAALDQPIFQWRSYLKDCPNPD
jgi:hypothetical protein